MASPVEHSTNNANRIPCSSVAWVFVAVRQREATQIMAAAPHPDVTTMSPTASAPVAGAPLRTRKQAVQRLQERGYPIALSTMNKLCAMGLGPDTAGVFGSRDIYDEDVVVAWAQARAEAGKAARVKVADPAADTSARPKSMRGRPPKPRPDVDGTASTAMTTATTSPGA